MKQLELNFENKKEKEDKPHYLYNPVTDKLDNVNSPTFFQDRVSGPEKIKIEKKIATMGDDKSKGAWKAHVARNDRYEKEQKEKLNNLKNDFGSPVLNTTKDKIKYTVENSSVPVSKAPQGSPKHKSDIISYIEKMNDIYGKGNETTYPNEATPTQVGDLAKRLEESRQSTGELSTWDLMKKTAHTSEEKNDIKRILNKQYYSRGPKDMDPDDLKFIGKHKSQTQTIYPKIEIPRVGIDESLISKSTRPPQPELTVNEQIKILADRRLENEQKVWDQQHGRSGITDLLRPI